MNSGIYIIQNKVNNKVYVGSAVDIQKRWERHKRDLCKGKHHSVLLQRSWDKYGEESFEFVVIELCQPENLIKLEQFMLDLLCSYEEDKGYNICSTAGSCLGRTHSEESKRKMSKAHKGKKYCLGRTHSPETKKKMSKNSAMRKNAKGYYYEKASGKYRAAIMINRKRKYLGYYSTPEEAHAAYLSAVEKVQQKPSGTLTGGI